MIKIINNKDISTFSSSGYVSVPNENFITDFKQINIFIGGNNSGKSRFLRLIIEDLKKILESNNKINKYLLAKESEFNQNLQYLYNVTQEDVFNVNLISENIKDNFWNNFNKAKIDHYKENIIKPKNYLFKVNNAVIGALDKILDIHTHIFSDQKQGLVTERFRLVYTYIPILRGLKPLQVNEKTDFEYKDVYANRILTDYPNIKNIVTGLGINEEIKKRLLGDENERLIIKQFENYISEHLFGEHVTLIPKYGDDILNIKIGEDPQRSIVDLGDGLQALICLLFPIFMEKDKEYYFFIEEPELNLNPLLQKKLISLLCTPIFKLHQYFITTHSAHIIDLENASIYNFTKKDDRTIITHLDNQSKIVGALNNMGYTPSDLLQTNFIIWVEGETDKMIINHLIKKFHPSLNENYHYSIMFYGGSGDKHLLNDSNNFEFIFALNRNCAIIKDSDRTKASDDVTHKENKFKALEKLGVLTWLTPKREIENHISKEDFIQAIRLQQKNENLEIIEPTPYGDYYKVKNIHEVDQPYSPKRYIYLSEGLFKEIGIRKGNLTKSDVDLIKKELQKSINETKNTIPIRDKVAVVEKLTEIDYEVDNDLEAFINRLCNKIKEVNQIK